MNRKCVDRSWCVKCGMDIAIGSSMKIGHWFVSSKLCGYSGLLLAKLEHYTN